MTAQDVTADVAGQQEQIASVMASWRGPAWAETHDSDEEALIYVRALGAVADLDGNDWPVLLEQRDQIHLLLEEVSVDRAPAYVLVHGTRYSIEQALRLSQLLASVDRLQVETGSDQGSTVARPGPGPGV